MSGSKERKQRPAISGIDAGRLSTASKLGNLTNKMVNSLISLSARTIKRSGIVKRLMRECRVRPSIDAATICLSCLARRFQSTGSATIDCFPRIAVFCLREPTFEMATRNLSPLPGLTTHSAPSLSDSKTALRSETNAIGTTDVRCPFKTGPNRCRCAGSRKATQEAGSPRPE